MTPENAPVFVLSCARTGSTLLRLVLDTHPDVYAPPELNLGRLASDLYLACSSLQGRKVALHAARQDPEVLAHVRGTISGLLDAATAQRGKKIWCEKSPGNLEHLDLVAGLYPEARFLCLHRHFADVAHSCLENCRYGFMPVLVDYVRQSPRDILEAIVRYWADGTSALLDFERQRPEQCFRIRYEDLVDAPEATSAALFSFLGLPWDPALLSAVFTTRHDAGIGDSNVQFAGRIRQDSVGAGRDIPFALRPALQSRVHELLGQLGYDALPPARPAASTPAAQAAAPQTAASPDGPRWVFETHLPERLRSRPEKLSAIGSSYRFVVGGDGGGAWVLEVRDGDFVVIPGGEQAATTIAIDAADLLGIVHGELNLLKVLREGKIRASGEVPGTEQLQELVMLLRTDL